MLNILQKTSEALRIKEYKERVISYYDVITEPYRQFWGEYFHPAFFEAGDTLQSALEKTHSLFISDSKLEQGGSALDLGSGIGSFSFYIAKHAGAKVIGVNFSRFQLKKAREQAKKQGYANVEFIESDIMKFTEPGNCFDAAFLIDVGCHLPDKAKAVKNIYNLLKPGGRLIIADWLQKDNPTAYEKELLLEPFNELWNYPYMESLAGYKKIFDEVGFKAIKTLDVSEATKPNWELFYNIAISEVKTMDWKKMLRYIANPTILRQGSKFIEATKKQFYANLFSKAAFDAEVFRYGYFVVEK